MLQIAQDNQGIRAEAGVCLQAERTGNRGNHGPTAKTRRLMLDAIASRRVRPDGDPRPERTGAR
jgi:hypothetical protein